MSEEKPNSGANVEKSIPCCPPQTHSSENHQCDPMSLPHPAKGGYRRWQMGSHQVIWFPKHKSDMGPVFMIVWLFFFCLLCISMGMEIKKLLAMPDFNSPTPKYAKIEVNPTISSTSNLDNYKWDQPKLTLVDH